MSPDLLFWLALATKMAVTAAFVVFATWAAERAGALIGALVVTLPIAAGPAYVFVALDHDATFIAATALASLGINAATGIFCLAYSILAQSRGLLVSFTAALGSWIALAFLLRSIEWTLTGAILLNIAVYAVSIPLGERFRHAIMPPAVRRWYDVPLRAGMVAVLVAIVVALSARVGPAVTVTLALFPVVLVSVVLIFQPRIGGPATAALIANAISGLAGYAAALVVLYLMAMPAGVPAALILALAISIGWNLMIWGIHRGGAASADPAKP